MAINLYIVLSIALCLQKTTYFVSKDYRMKFFSIAILFIISILCNNNLFAFYTPSNEYNQRYREEMKQELAHIASYKYYKGIKFNTIKEIKTDTNYKERKKLKTVLKKSKYEVSTPIHLFDAVQQDDPDYVQAVLKKYPEWINTTDNVIQRQTCLYFAYHQNSPKIVRMLIKAGIKVDHLNASKSTALGSIIDKHFPPLETVELLLKYSSAINYVNNEGYTPLYLLVLGTIKLINFSEKYDTNIHTMITHKINIIKLLLSYGADTRITDLRAQTIKDRVKTALKNVPKHTHYRHKFKRLKKAIKKSRSNVQIQQNLDTFSKLYPYADKSIIIKKYDFKLHSSLLATRCPAALSLIEQP